MEEIRKKYLELKKEILEANRLYYSLNTNTISDYEYDMKVKQLEEYERNFPQLIDETSPSVLIGDDFLNESLGKVEHKDKMYSLQNTYNEDDIKSFLKTTNTNEYIVQEKIDGLSLELYYKNGNLTLALTRGNGLIGEDVTRNAMNIDNIPKKIRITEDLVIRGEAYIPRSKFIEINEKQKSLNDKPFANARNLASGTLKSHKPHLVKERSLMFIAYWGDRRYFTEEHSELKILHTLENEGFSVPKYTKLVKGTTNEECYKSIHSHIEAFKEKKHNLDYDTDGIVIKCNDLSKQEELGYTEKYPIHSVAFKYPTDEVETKLLSVEYQLGRTGVITPVANFKPVHISGSMVSKASLYNFDEIKRLNLKEGDTIYVTKAAEIIPKVIRVKDGNENGKKIEKIINCPFCNHTLTERNGEEINLYCTNEECPEREIQKLIWFASKEGMDISGLGEKTIRSLYKENIIREIPDILNLPSILSNNNKETSLSEKKKEQLISSIRKSYTNKEEQLLNAFGLRNIGKVLSRQLIDHFGSMENLLNASKNDLLSLDGISETIAESLINELSNEKIRENIRTCLHFMTKREKKEKIDDSLNNLSFCLSGSFQIPKKDIEQYIEERGGKVTSSVTSNTSYLISNGELNGKKLETARKKNVKVITYNELLNLNK